MEVVFVILFLFTVLSIVLMLKTKRWHFKISDVCAFILLNFLVALTGPLAFLMLGAIGFYSKESNFF